jgi:Zn-dependent metalloprotease
MSFGDGNGSTVRPLVSIDIIGHEVSHGVTASTADLIYNSESGGLNEATSDIFGTMIGVLRQQPKQPPNYVIGDQIFTTPAWNKFIRTMFKPNLDGISPDCYPSATKPVERDHAGQLQGHGRHYSSGVRTTSSTCSPKARSSRPITQRARQPTWARATWCATATSAWPASAATRPCRSGIAR